MTPEELDEELQELTLFAFDNGLSYEEIVLALQREILNLREEQFS